MVDLGRSLDLPEHEAGGPPGTCVSGPPTGSEVGLRVDRLDEIQLLAPGELAAPPEAKGGAVLHLLKGLAADRLRLLNIEALFAHPVFQKAAS